MKKISYDDDNFVITDNILKSFFSDNTVIFN